MKPHLEYFAKEAELIISERKGAITPTVSPYVGRALLEGGFTALLFRIDPFRALTLQRFQAHAKFDQGRRNPISIDWATDLVPNIDEPTDIWQPKMKPDLVSRALLSQYQDNILWQPAFNKARDYLDSRSVIFSFRTLLSDDPTTVFDRLRGEVRQLYSFWSK